MTQDLPENPRTLGRLQKEVWRICEDFGTHSDVPESIDATPASKEEFAAELATIVVRVADLAESADIDLEAAVVDEMETVRRRGLVEEE